MNGVIQTIADELLLPVQDIRHTIAFAPLRQRRFTIPKKSGERRQIIQPAVKLKPILYWLHHALLSKLPVNSIATAFRPGKSILENASIHRGSRYSVRVDISKFFESIRRNDLLLVIEQTKDFLPPWAITTEAINLVAKVCFDRDGKLPIGYSTSPSIANAVMFNIDSALVERIAKEAEFGQAKLTRYADDFVFSTDKEGGCNAFVVALSQILLQTQSPSLTINQTKTKFMSRGGGSTLITGLRVNNQGNVVVHANYRDHVRLLLKLYKAEQLKVDDIPKLIGHLAHIQHVDPALFTKLSFKFHKEISTLRSSALGDPA